MRTSKKCPRAPISVLKVPPKNLFVSAPSPSSQYELFHVAGKKMCIEAYRTFVSKAKLFANLQIYEWRNQTQFPIARTKYVTIQQSHQQLGQLIELTVYNQHCPLKLNRIYEMTLPQTLYMLKESIIGFQRLHAKFCAFQIKQGMIAVNQKGFCRVWANQNFSINSVSRPVESQGKMLESLYDIMEKHCQETKSMKKLFLKLKNCNSFLSALKQIELFVMTSKVLVSSRYVMSPSSCKQIYEAGTLNNLMRNECVSLQNIRYSIVSSKFKNSKTEEVKQGNVEQSLNNLKFNCSENEIKRFKSLQRIKAANIMKVSDGQTAYTRNNKETKCSNLGVSHREQAAEKHVCELEKKPIRKWLQDSTFVMELEEDSGNKRQPKDKKQMSYSTDVVIKKIEQKQKSCIKSPRKLSANICLNRQQHPIPYYKFQASPKETYTHEFHQVIDSDPKQESVSTPRGITRREKSRITQEELDKSQVEHMDTIMKSNGWNGISGFLAVPKELKESFHEGKEENRLLNEFKLQRLEGIAKRAVAMSLMPAQYEDII